MGRDIDRHIIVLSVIMLRAELTRHTVIVLSVIMPRAELTRYTVIVLSVSVCLLQAFLVAH